MRQRVMIAMALGLQPKLLIADEPTTALDVTIQAQILELIKILQEEEGMSVLFITHDMGVVAEIADRVVVMYKGKAVEQGSTEQVFRAPRAPYTQALLSAVPRLGSMAGRRRPMRFPVVDIVTGGSDVPVEVPDTVAAERPLLEVSDLTTRFDIRGGVLSRIGAGCTRWRGCPSPSRPGRRWRWWGSPACGKSTTGRSSCAWCRPARGGSCSRAWTSPPSTRPRCATCASACR
jgi:peptide/nickel transport system ATP-binding protein